MAIAAAFAAFAITNVAGVLLFFKGIADADQGRELAVNPILGVAIYSVCAALLLAYAARVTGSAFRAATIIAAAQFILVDVDFVVRGERGLMTAAASSALLVLTWYAAAAIFKLVDRKTG